MTASPSSGPEKYAHRLPNIRQNCTRMPYSCSINAPVNSSASFRPRPGVSISDIEVTFAVGDPAEVVVERRQQFFILIERIGVNLL